MLFEAQRSKETARGAVSVAVSRQEVCTVAASRHGHQKSRHSRHPQAFGVKITRPGASRRFARALRKQMKLTARMHAPAGQFSTGSWLQGRPWLGSHSLYRNKELVKMALQMSKELSAWSTRAKGQQIGCIDAAPRSFKSLHRLGTLGLMSGTPGCRRVRRMTSSICGPHIFK